MGTVMRRVFLPDFFWIGFAAIGLEPATDTVFFDGWSHSLVSVLIEATVFAALFYRESASIRVAIWIAVFSHFCLDCPIHPKPIELFPYSQWQVPWDLWAWGRETLLLGKSHYWWLQLCIVMLLLAIYAVKSNRLLFSRNLIAASCVLVLGFHLML